MATSPPRSATSAATTLGQGLPKLIQRRRPVEHETAIRHGAGATSAPARSHFERILRVGWSLRDLRHLVVAPIRRPQQQHRVGVGGRPTGAADPLALDRIATSPPSPAVSCRITRTPAISSSASTTSRVVPGAARRWRALDPTRRLKRVDFPEFGGPRMTTRTPSRIRRPADAVARSAAACARHASRRRARRVAIVRDVVMREVEGGLELGEEIRQRRPRARRIRCDSRPSI